MKRVVYIVVVMFFTSCIGIKTDIQVKRDLSGTARLVYTVSEEFLGSGTLDGNENWPSLPVAKADFERTVARIDGLQMRSYYEKKAGGDRLFEILLAFDHVSALARFLDGNGQQVVYKNEGGEHVFTILFNGGSQTYDDALLSLVQSTFAGYRFDFSISVPGGEKSYSAPMADLLTSAQQERLEIRF
jgi:hypothetical protein